MKKQLIIFLDSRYAGKKILLLFFLTNVLYAIMLLVTIPKTIQFAEGMKLLDMMPLGYDYKYVDELFNTLGENGRQVYLTNQIPVDMAYPLFFGFTYCLILAFFLKKLNWLKAPFYYLCLLPVTAGIADYMENTGIIAMLKTYPDLSANLVSATNIFSLIKSTLTSLYFVVLMVVIISVGAQALKKLTLRSQ